MGCKSGSAARAVRQNLVAFIYQSGLEELVDYPPACFDVIVIKCYIRIIQINHESHALAHLLPHVLVGENRGLALFVEFCNSVFFNLLLAFNAQLLLNFDFNRKTVGIPACFSVYLVALHRPVSVN